MEKRAASFSKASGMYEQEHGIKGQRLKSDSDETLNSVLSRESNVTTLALEKSGTKQCVL
jgi:hypothetical protein